MRLQNLGKPYYYKKQLAYLYYKYVAPYKNIELSSENTDIKLSDWANSLSRYERVVVVAGGPSTNKISEHVFTDKTLFIPTNGSVTLVRHYHYIYFLAEARWVYRYLKQGVLDPFWQGTIFRLETKTASASVRQVALDILQYKSKYKREMPEVFASDISAQGVYRDNYEELEFFIFSKLGLKFKQFNSGFGALQTGFYFAARLNIPLHIYGMDAGITGPVHFDGTEVISDAVSGSKVRDRLQQLLLALYAQEMIPVSNYSAFLTHNAMASL